MLYTAETGTNATALHLTHIYERYTRNAFIHANPAENEIWCRARGDARLRNPRKRSSVLALYSD